MKTSNMFIAGGIALVAMGSLLLVASKDDSNPHMKWATEFSETTRNLWDTDKDVVDTAKNKAEWGEAICDVNKYYGEGDDLFKSPQDVASYLYSLTYNENTTLKEVAAYKAASEWNNICNG